MLITSEDRIVTSLKDFWVLLNFHRLHKELILIIF